MTYQDFMKRASGLFPSIIFLSVFLLIEGVFQFFLIPGFQQAAGGAGIPDMAAAYHPDFLYGILAVMEGDALGWYNRIQLADCLFPLGYAGLLSSLLFRIYRRKYDDFGAYRWIVSVPLVAAGFDYLENIGIRSAILLLPRRSDLLGWVLSVVSSIKFLALLLSVLLVLTGFGYFIKGRRDAHFAKK